MYINIITPHNNMSSEEKNVLIAHLKWSRGEKYEKSFKIDRQKYFDDIEKNSNLGINNEDNKEDYNKMKPLIFDDTCEPCIRISNKREDANTKLNERVMFGSINQNPFMTQSNYINDLEIQDSFLKPKNSNFNIET